MPRPSSLGKVNPDLFVQAACFVIFSDNLTGSRTTQESCRAVTAHAKTAAI